MTVFGKNENLVILSSIHNKTPQEFNDSLGHEIGEIYLETYKITIKNSFKKEFLCSIIGYNLLIPSKIFRNLYTYGIKYLKFKHFSYVPSRLIAHKYSLFFNKKFCFYDKRFKRALVMDPLSLELVNVDNGLKLIPSKWIKLHENETHKYFLESEYSNPENLCNYPEHDNKFMLQLGIG